MDASLINSLSRSGAAPALVVLAWLAILAATFGVARLDCQEFTRTKAGLLVCASLLLAPYSAGNSLLVVLALGTVGLLPQHPRLTLLLFGLADLGYLAPQSSLMFEYGARYATLLFLLNWLALAWAVRSRRSAATCTP